MAERKLPFEPYKIKTVEPLKITTREERDKIIRDAGLNVFSIPAEKVLIDLLTDSGTSAMSNRQWAGIMLGDESYAGATSYFRFNKSVKNVFGFKHVIPTHQGRAAERILFQVLLKAGDYVPSNIHFDTTRANIEVLDARAEDLIKAEAYDPEIVVPFKGDIDLEKLEKFIQDKGPEKIPLVMLTITNNSGGGQPVSMENIRETSRVCHKHELPFFIDACRFAENAFFVQKREKEYSSKSILEIARETFSYADGATMSAKKDALVNIGGFICLNDDGLEQKLRNNLIVSEGFPTYGGLAGRDLEAIARGLEEVVDQDYLAHRVDQVGYLWDLLNEGGVPVYAPAGGHAVYILADKFLPHIPREHYPGWALTVALYRESGIRAVEIGGVMFSGKDEKTGKDKFPELELVRLAIPRRVYTASHINFVAQALIDLYKEREKVNGLKITYQAPNLRHFTARFEEV